MEATKEFIQELIEKFGTNEIEINTKFDRELEFFKKSLPHLKDENKLIKITQQRVKMGFKKVGAIETEIVTMIITGVDRKIDMTAKRIKNARNLFNEDPLKAKKGNFIQCGLVLKGNESLDIDEKYVMKGNFKQCFEKVKEMNLINEQYVIEIVKNETGECIPIDALEFWNAGKETEKESPNFGKPLKVNDYTRKIYGIGITEEDEKNKKDPQPFILNVKGKLVDLKPILFDKYYKVRILNNTYEDSEYYKFNGVESITNFSDEIKEEVDMVKISSMINEFFVEPENLTKYHKENNEDWDRFCYINSIIAYVNREPSSTGNRRIIIENPEEEKGIVCWVPESVDIKYVQVGLDAKIMAKTSEMKKDDGSSDISLNVLGIYVEPTYRILPDIDEVSDNELKVNSDNSDEDEIAIEE
jgi:hypothetical protein